MAQDLNVHDRPTERRDSLPEVEASTARVRNDKAQIDDIARRFFAGFTNKAGTLPAVGELARLFLSGAIVVKAVGAHPEIMDVRQFIAPREALLTDGRLVEFEELEVHEHTEVHGNVAQRWSTYRKSGILNGEPFEGAGQKSLQLVKTADGWKISALAWDDEREGS